MRLNWLLGEDPFIRIVAGLLPKGGQLGSGIFSVFGDAEMAMAAGNDCVVQSSAEGRADMELSSEQLRGSEGCPFKAVRKNRDQPRGIGVKQS